MRSIDGRCEACGEPNPGGTQFCLFCGEYLGWAEVTESEEAQPEVDVQPTSEKGQPNETDPPAEDAPKPVTTPAASPDEAIGSTSPQPSPSRPADKEAATALAAETREPSPVATVPACPDCGRPQDPALRFCSTCGRPYGTSGPKIIPRGEQPVSWWQRLLRTDDRKARRAYRRSLPPLYRWRRVAIGCALVVAFSFAFAIVGTNPAAWAQQRWYDVTGALVQVQGIEAEALPEGSDLDGSAAALVDADPGTAWETTWQAPEADSACGQSPSGRVKVSFPETRLREVRVRPGLKNPSTRSLQQLPAAVDLTFPDGTCTHMALTQSFKQQSLALDSEVPISHMFVSIPEVHKSADERSQDVVAVSMLALFSRP